MLRYLLYLPVDIAVTILAIILAFPVALITTILGRDTAPGPLALLHTHDHNLDGMTTVGEKKKSGLGLVIQRTKWIMRNPAYGFKAKVLGIKAEGTTYKTLHQSGSFENKDFFQKIEMINDGKKYFGWRKLRVGWFGWRYPADNQGYHIYKFSPRFHKDT